MVLVVVEAEAKEAYLDPESAIVATKLFPS